MTLSTDGIRITAVIAAAALIAATILASGGSDAGARGNGGGSPRPNVVIVQTDDQTTESLRVMPNVRKLLAQKGTSFRRHIVNWPLCCPSRTTLQTGQYAHNHGVLGNSPPNGGFQAFDTSNSLAVWLEDANYTTGHVGKYLNGYGGASTETLVPPGWTEWYTGVGSTQAPYNYRLNENGTLVDYGSSRVNYKGDVFTRKALDFIDRRAPKRRPFFLQLDYTAPHGSGPGPWPQGPTNCGGSAQPAPRHGNAFDDEKLPKPPSFNEADVSDKPNSIQNLNGGQQLDSADIATIRNSYRCRLESLLHVDEGVAKLVKRLKRAGELGNTVIVFTADNGFFHGEHRVKSGKSRFYEESARTPLIIRGPGFPRDKAILRPVTNADIAPTIVSLTEAEPQRVMDGRGLRGVAKNPSVIADRELLIETNNYTAVRSARYVYAEHDTGEKELYDLTKDPFQLQSRHDDPALASVQANLAAKLAQLRGCAGATCRN